MTQRINNEDPETLKEQLAHTSDSKLSHGAANVEGINGNSGVVPEYFFRHIKFYHITEQELKAVTLANSVMTASFSIGTFFFAFWLDIFKDTVLAESVPKHAQAALDYVQPASLVLSILFIVFGAWSVFWRYNFIGDIKKQSREADRLGIDRGAALQQKSSRKLPPT